MTRLFVAMTLVLILAPGLALAQSSDPDFGDVTPVKLSPHVFELAKFPNIAVIVGNKATLVVDTGLGPKAGGQIAAAAAKLAPGNKLYLTTTHFHPEHASGDSGFPAGTVLIRAREQQAEMDRSSADILAVFRKRPAFAPLLQNVTFRQPDILFDREYKLDLGGESVRLLWYGAAHTVGDEEILVEDDSLLVTGDVIQNKTMPAFAAAEATPRKWLETVRRLKVLNPRLVMPDHSPPGDGVALIAAEETFLSDLDSRAKTLKRQGVPVAQAGPQISQAMKAQYADWAARDLSDAVARSYADTE